ncbi:hypothetical protein L1887_28401 [Cichorium endivia]|nr:hypothetical protein L1887_28401 [Cichorium endivia]
MYNIKLYSLSSTSLLPLELIGSLIVEVSDRERLLLTKVFELQSRLTILTEELTAKKSKYIQLQQRVDAIAKGEADAS